MTFDDIVDAVMERLNLTTTEAEDRIGETVNRVYKRVTTASGLNLSKRSTVNATMTVGVSAVTFTGVEKIINVIDRSVTPWRVLREESLETMQRMQRPSTLSIPGRWAEQSYTANTVTILLDCVPADALVLYADGYVVKPTLSGSNEPTFPESFHEVLYYGALADEYDKKEKQSLSKKADDKYREILSDLKFFINKTSAQDIMQGKNKHMPLMSGGSGGSGSGSGDAIQGSGTINKYAKWSGATALTDAILAESGNALYWQDTSNANNTNGLTINQLAADNHALTLKSSDVATGVTSAFSAGFASVETDDYFAIQKSNLSFGGARLVAVMENNASQSVFAITAIGGQANTNKSVSAIGLVDVYASQHDGANGASNIDADGNVFVIAAQIGGARQARWLIDEDGDSWQAGGITASGPSYVGDSANASNLAGLTINQGAADDIALSLKSSDVASGLTSGAGATVETDDYCSLSKFASATGGLRIQAIGENAAVTTNFALQSYGGQADTTKSTAGRGLIELYATQHDGANAQTAVAANGNVLAIRCNQAGSALSVLVLDEDGDVWIAGGLLSAHPTSGIGYTTGAGGTIGQTGSKAGAVTLNAVTGHITMNNAALNAGVIVTFVLTNSAITANDILILNHISGGTPGSYGLNGRCTGASTASIDVRNNTAGNLSEAIVIAFAVIKAVIA